MSWKMRENRFVLDTNAIIFLTTKGNAIMSINTVHPIQFYVFSTT